MKSDNILKMPRLWVFLSLFINSRILLVKLGLRVKYAICFKDKRRPSSHLAKVMLRRTPGIYQKQIYFNILKFLVRHFVFLTEKVTDS